MTDSRGRTLYLLRHGKSSWDHPVDDHARPLAPRGRRAAPAMAGYMVENGLVPDAVLCSTALRARETWEEMSSAFGPALPVSYHGEIYHHGPRAILSLIRSAGSGAGALGGDRDAGEPGSLLVIGHNPALVELAVGLAGSGDAAARDRMGRKFPTAALAVLEFPGAWREAAWGTASLVRFVRPKDLPEADARRL